MTAAWTMTQRTSIDPLGAGALLATVLAICVGAGALIGLAAGMVLAPWLERWYRLVLKKSEEDRHDRK